MTDWRDNPDHPEWADLPDWYTGPKGPSWDFVDGHRYRLWASRDRENARAWFDWVKKVAPDTGKGPATVSRNGEVMSVEYYDDPYRIVGPFELDDDGSTVGGKAATHHVHVNCSEVEIAPCWPPTDRELLETLRLERSDD